MPGFLARVLGLPFRPELWRASAEQPALATALPLLVVILIADAAIGLIHAERARAAIYRVADVYASSADVLVFRDGRFSLSGPRIFQMTEGDVTILVDPQSTVPESAIQTSTALVVREDRVIVRGRTQTRELDAAAFADPEPLVIDAAEVRQVADQVVFWTLLVLFGLMRPWFDIAASGGYALLAGGLLHTLRGKRLGLSFAGCFKLALATCAATAVLEIPLVLLPVSVPLLARPALWLVLSVGLGLLALAPRSLSARA